MQRIPKAGRLAGLAASAVLMTALLAACGGGGSTGPAPAPAAAPDPGPAGADHRPQLDDAAAAGHTPASYLAQAGTLSGPQGAGLTVDHWMPPAVGEVANLQATYTVAADGSGTHTRVQDAIDAVPAAADSRDRVYIRVKPGIYREVVCVRDKAPITLYGSGSDASQVLIVHDNYSGKPKAAGQPANPCNPNLDSTTHGTSGSASVAIYSADFHAKNLSFGNDAMKDVVAGVGYPPGGEKAAQAVALMTQGDRLVFEQVRVLGHQDTLYIKTANAATVARAYFKDCHVEGDVDFIFGRGTLVMDRCTIHFLSRRLGPGHASPMIAPSTSPLHERGFLILDSRFTADAQASAGTSYLGRAWDEGVPAGTWVAGSSPNGQLLIRDSLLGPHIRSLDPWAASTSRRDFSAAVNRFAEYRNTGRH